MVSEAHHRDYLRRKYYEFIKEHTLTLAENVSYIIRYSIPEFFYEILNSDSLISYCFSVTISLSDFVGKI